MTIMPDLTEAELAQLQREMDAELPCYLSDEELERSNNDRGWQASAFEDGEGGCPPARPDDSEYMRWYLAGTRAPW